VADPPEPDAIPDEPDEQLLSGDPVPPRADDPVDKEEMKGHNILDNAPGDGAEGTN